ncbi:unnamed protein product [marine sediment metagenome]|uniref:Uncharacterized protein n=1 Tax=marine sediment metagenome TaxID=412755 RepID=X1FUM5_9ZZZZ
MFIRNTLRYRRQKPGGLEKILSHGGTSLRAADEFSKVVVVLTVNELSGNT